MSDPTIEVKPAGDPPAEPSEAKEAAAPAPPEEKAPPTPEELLAQAKAEAAKTKEQLLRTAADFDNFRKRSRKEIEDARKAGKEDLLKEFLPVFDNLERGMQSAKNATDVSAVAEGLAMVLRQFVDTMAASPDWDCWSFLLPDYFPGIDRSPPLPHLVAEKRKKARSQCKLIKRFLNERDSRRY